MSQNSKTPMETQKALGIPVEYPMQEAIDRYILECAAKFSGLMGWRVLTGPAGKFYCTLVNDDEVGFYLGVIATEKGIQFEATE